MDAMVRASAAVAVIVIEEGEELENAPMTAPEVRTTAAATVHLGSHPFKYRA